MNVETKERGAICDAIASLSKAGVKLSKPAIRSVMKTAEVGKSVLRAAARALVLNARGGPCARSSSSDGTLVTMKIAASGEVDGKKFTRSGRETHEFLVAHSFFRVTNALTRQLETKMVFGDPVPLTHGKSIPAQFESMRPQLPTLRQLGHEGIAVEQY